MDFEWNLNPERDITGYQVFWAGADGWPARPTTCASAQARAPAPRSCPAPRPHATGPSPAATRGPRYYISRARRRERGRAHDARRSRHRPRSPRSRPPSTVAGTFEPKLTWTPPATGGAPPTAIYRDGTAIGDRQVRTNALTYTDAGARHHSAQLLRHRARREVQRVRPAGTGAVEPVRTAQKADGLRAHGAARRDDRRDAAARRHAVHLRALRRRTRTRTTPATTPSSRRATRSTSRRASCATSPSGVRQHRPVIDTVGADDIIFQTSDSDRARGSATASTPPTPTKSALFQQTQQLSVTAAPSPITASMRSGCPSTSSSWTRTVNVAGNVVNRIGGRNVPAFTYRCADGGTACTSSTAAFDPSSG